MPAIVQTAHGTIDTVIAAMRAGAVDFVVKPVGAERLSVSIKNALRFDALEDEVRRMTRRASGALTFRDIVTKSDDMGRAIRLGERSARSNIPVLIEGESGVGKELMARAIQGSSERKRQALRAGELRRAAREPRSSRSCSATRRAPSRAPPRSISASSSRPTAARCSSTRSASCRSTPR